MTRMTRTALLALVPLLSGSGCMLWMRDADFYAAQLEERLDAAGEPIAACYDRYLAEHDPSAAGELVVRFEIAAKTGKVGAIAVDPARTSVPEPLARCVTEPLAGFVMDPPDAKPAKVEFAWTFVRGPAKAPPVDPFIDAQTVLLGCYAEHLAKFDREASGTFVIDYAFDRETGAIERLAVLAESTAPGSVLACAEPAFAGAKIDPGDLDERNVAGRRSFPLRFTPYVAPVEPPPVEPPPAEPPPAAAG